MLVGARATARASGRRARGTGFWLVLARSPSPWKAWIETARSAGA
jgi:hypothetical protein